MGVAPTESFLFLTILDLTLGSVDTCLNSARPEQISSQNANTRRTVA